MVGSSVRRTSLHGCARRILPEWSSERNKRRAREALGVLRSGLVPGWAGYTAELLERESRRAHPRRDVRASRTLRPTRFGSPIEVRRGSLLLAPPWRLGDDCKRPSEAAAGVPCQGVVERP